MAPTPNSTLGPTKLARRTEVPSFPFCQLQSGKKGHGPDTSEQPSNGAPLARESLRKSPSLVSPNLLGSAVRFENDTPERPLQGLTL